MTPSARERLCVADALASATARLRDAGVEGAARDATLLLSHATGLERSRLMGHPDLRLMPREVADFEACLSRRLAREPVSRILGRRAFWDLTMQLSAATFDPRPETELLVEALLDRYREREDSFRILDLGTGSGCILLALLKSLPRATGLGVDIDEAAVAMAQRNAKDHGLSLRATFETRTWGDGLGGQWQVIVSNPPYIVDEEIKQLAPEVARFDPALALSGGPDGLDRYRELLPHAARLLAPDGLLALELGFGQAKAVTGLLADVGMVRVEVMKDLAGIDRCLLARRGPGRGS